MKRNQLCQARLASVICTLLLALWGMNPGHCFAQDKESHSVKGSSGITVFRGMCSKDLSDYYIYFGWKDHHNLCSSYLGSYSLLHIDEYVPEKDDYSRIISDLRNMPSSYDYMGKAYKHAVGPNRRDPYYKFTGFYSGLVGWVCKESRVAYNYGTTARLGAPGTVRATDSEYDDKVVVTWEIGDTDVPEEKYGFNVYRDGKPIHTVDPVDRELKPGDKMEFIDDDVEPGRVYTYAVERYYDPDKSQTSEWVEDKGNAHSLKVQVSDSPSGLLIRWEWPASMKIDPEKYVVSRVDENGNKVSYEPDVSFGKTSRYDIFDKIPGYKYLYIVEPVGAGSDFNSDSTRGGIAPNGSISGKVTTPINPETGRSSPVMNILVCAERSDEDDIPQGEDTLYCAMTKSDGSYLIDSIYYFTGASFKIWPSKENHVFKEEYVDTVLTEKGYELMHVDFIDESSVAVSGRIFQVFNGDTCGLEHAEILVDTVSSGWMSDSAGYYSLSLDLLGEYSFEPLMKAHTFLPASLEIMVDDDISGLDFEDTTVFTLSGRVSAACNTSIGTAELQVKSLGANACFETTVLSDAEGFYEIALPARSYQLEVIGLEPHDDMLIRYFNKDTVDLSYGNMEKNFTYRTPPTILLSNLPTKGGGDYQVPIWKQYVNNMVKIEVLDTYEDNTCPVQDGHVVITDEVSDELTEPVVLKLDSTGTAWYRLMAGTPNLYAMPAAHPYQKRLHVAAHAGQERSVLDQYILVTGHRPRTPEFYNSSPELVHWVLRDPPGDMSFAKLEKDSSLSTFISQEIITTDAHGLHADLQLGFIASFGDKVSIDAGVYAYGFVDALKVDESDILEGKHVTLTTKEEFRTSDGDKVLGEEGDVFIGATYTMVYGLTDVLDFDWEENQVVRDTLIAWDIDSVESTFMYTESHIRNEVIPELEFLREQSDPEEAAGFQEDLDRWQYELFFNDSLKKEAVFKENIDFSGGIAYSYESNIDSLDVDSKKIRYGVDREWGAGVGGVFSGCAVNLGYRGAYNKMTSNDTLKEAQSGFTTGFHLEDDDPEDEFSVSVKEDRFYGTPVFELFSGTTSCPWEAGSQPHEGVAMSLDTYEQSVPADQIAYFKLFLVNASESGKSGDYRLSMVHASNPEGAIVEVGSAPMGDDELKFDQMPPNSENPQVQTVRVRRAEGSSFVYEGLQLQFFSACDPQIISRVTFDVHFENTCSDVFVAQPVNNWYIGNGDAEALSIVLADYDPSDSKITKLGFQYRMKGSIGWREVFSLDGAFLPADSLRYPWDVSELEDGQYELRAFTLCGGGYYYSPRINGMIDHSEFTLEGSLQPADGIYRAGDEISVTYNAIIDPATATLDHVRLVRLNNDSQVDIGVSCKDNKLLIEPDPEESLEHGEKLLAVVADVADLEGNCMQFPVSWEFKVQEGSTGISARQFDDGFFLGQNYPNPFRDETMITYSIPGEGHVRLSVLDLNGREVMRLVDHRQQPGSYAIPVHAENLESGVYIYQIRTSGATKSRRMILME